MDRVELGPSFISNILYLKLDLSRPSLIWDDLYLNRFFVNKFIFTWFYVDRILSGLSLINNEF